jgi:hypothetical protein
MSGQASAQTSHNPLPWKADGRALVFDCTNELVANALLDNVRGSRANAELIVRCVNSHHDLLSTLKALVKREYKTGGQLLNAPEIASAEAAIERAEGR